MAETPSTMLALGTPAPDFRLPDTTGKLVSLSDFKGAPALLVLFICNHCPFVKHIRSGLTQFVRDYQARGLAIVAINANDAASYPDDSRPGNNRPVTGSDLRAAADAVLAGRPVAPVQKASIGCNIKWKAGNEPEYFLRR